MISVIIPAHNCEQYIEQAVRSAEEQTVREKVEIIVIDDASQDHTKDVVEKLLPSAGEHKIIYHRNEKNLGAAETRNVGIRMAHGEYLAFLDADDWWEKDKLEKQMKRMRKTDMPFVYTGRELMNPDGSTTGKIVQVPETATYNSLLRTNCIPCSSVLIRTNIAREFYMCHDELHEDYILWLRVLKKFGTACGINEPLLKSRMSEGGKSRNKLKSARMHYGVYKYMGIPAWKALYLFACYAVNGIRKYI